MNEGVESGGPERMPPPGAPDGASDTTSPQGAKDVTDASGGAGDQHSGETPAAPAPPASAAADAAPSLSDVDREVEAAMAAMDPADIAELHGGVVATDSSTAGMKAGAGPDTEPGTELTGTVASIAGDDIFIEFGVKSQGVIPKSQFGKNETIEVGRRIDVVVERFDAESDLLIVNRKGATLRANWNNLAVGSIVQGKVIGVIKGGLEVSLSGIRAFMPGSQADVVPMKDISELLNQNIQCEVVEFNRRSKNVLVSRRRVLEREAAAAREAMRGKLAVGQVHKGVVKTLVAFGAFVDIGGIDGLAHISDLSWGSVDKVSDVLKVGQEVEVQILKIDLERDRISLGFKQCQPDPWEGAGEKYPQGTSLKVRVVRLASFGAFVELEAGVEGLVPISELSWTRVRQVSDVLSVGDMVDVTVIRFEAEKRRVALSVKQARPDPWEAVLESFPAKSLVTGKVTRLADFGAFVELVPGVEGLIHISELSDQRVRSCADVLSEGQEIEARVLSVDLSQRRISLSIKAVKEQVAEQPTEAEAARKPKKRKKALRGGLSSHFDW